MKKIKSNEKDISSIIIYHLKENPKRERERERFLHRIRINHSKKKHLPYSSYLLLSQEYSL